MRHQRRNIRRELLFRNSTGGVSTPPLTDDPNPIADSLDFWLEPTMGNPETDATGSVAFSTNGTPALSSTAGPNGQPMLELDGTSWLSTTDAGNGMGTISDSFWVYAIVDAPSISNQGICGSGGTGSTDDGWYAYIRSDGRLRMGVSDGTTAIQNNVGTSDINAPGGEVNSWIIQFDFETPASEKVIVYANGYHDPETTFEMDISSLSFPITADNDFGVGTRRGDAANLPLTGDIQLAMGQGVLTAEQRWYLTNHYRGRTYTEVEDKDYLDFIEYAQAGIPASNEFFFSARTDRDIVPKVYDLSGTLVATGSTITPVEGYANSSVTGSFTAGQKYEIRYEDPSTNKVSMHSNFVWAIPSDTDFDIFTFADWDIPETDGKDSYKLPFMLFRDFTKPTYGIMAGDFVYANNTTNTIEAFRDTMDAAFADQQNVWAVLSQMPFNDTYSDHDGPWVNSGGVDADSTSAVLTAAQGFWHARSPIGNRAEQTSGRINWSIDINDVKIIAPDLRSERNEASLIMTSSGVGSTQEWFGDQLDDAVTNQQAILWMSEVIFDSGGVDDQSWTNYSQRTDYFNEIASRSVLNHSGISYCGDSHGYGIDNGINQGQFDTNTVVQWPSMVAGPFNHGTRVTEGTWNQLTSGSNSDGTYGIINFTDNTSTGVTVTMSAYDSGQTQFGTYTKRLHKGPLSSTTFPTPEAAGDRHYHDAEGETAAVASSAWEVGQNPGSSTQLVRDNASAIKGKEVEFSHPGSGRNVWLLENYDDDLQEDQDIVAKIKMDSLASGGSGFLPALVLRYTGSSGNEDMLIAEFNGSNIECFYSSAGSFTSLGSFAFSRTVNTYFYARFSVIGDTVRCRAWNTQGAEPVSWGLEVTNGSIPSAGRMGIATFGSTTATVDVDFVSGAIDGTCGLAIAEADLPKPYVLGTGSGLDGSVRWHYNNVDGEENYVLVIPEYFGATVSGMRGITQDSGNGNIYYSNRTDGTVDKVDMFGRNRTAYLTTISDSFGIAVAKDRERFVVSSASNAEVYTCDLISGDEPILIKTGAGTTSFHLQYSETEKRVYYTEDNDGRHMTIEGDDDTLIWTSGSDLLLSIWSDGTYVVGGLNGTSVGQPVYTVGGVFERNTSGRSNVQFALIDAEAAKSDIHNMIISADSADRFDNNDLLDDSFYGDIDHNYSSSYNSRALFPGQLAPVATYSLITSSSGRDNDDFDGYSIGAGLMTGWTGGGTETNIAYAVAADAGSPGGQVFTIDKDPGDTSRVFATKDGTSGDDLSALLHFEATSNADVSLLINWDAGSENGYALGLSGSNLHLYSVTGGTYTSLTNSAVTYSAGTEYYLRFTRRPNGELRGRIWAQGTTEPSDWDVSNDTGTTYTSGVSGVGVYSAGGTYTATFHRLSTAPDGMQGHELNDADFPTEGVYFTDSTDESIRFMDEDGSNEYLIYIADADVNVNGLAIRNDDGTLFFSDLSGNNEMASVDRYGTRYNLIRTLDNQSFEMSYDPQFDRVYYNNRAATGTLYYVDINGHYERIVRQHGWLSQHAVANNEIYAMGLNNAYAITRGGAPIHQYASDTNGIGMAADASNIYVGSFAGGDLTTDTLRGTSYSIADAVVTNMWIIAVPIDEDQVFGSSLTTNEIYRWSSLPPTSGNRSTIRSQGIPYALAPFKFS